MLKMLNQTDKTQVAIIQNNAAVLSIVDSLKVTGFTYAAQDGGKPGGPQQNLPILGVILGKCDASGNVVPGQTTSLMLQNIQVTKFVDATTLANFIAYLENVVIAVQAAVTTAQAAGDTLSVVGINCPIPCGPSS